MRGPAVVKANLRFHIFLVRFVDPKESRPTGHASIRPVEIGVREVIFDSSAAERGIVKHATHGAYICAKRVRRIS